MDGTLAAGRGRRKHTFEFPLDTEQVFVHDVAMTRTTVRPSARGWLLAALVACGVGMPVAGAVGAPGETRPVAERRYVVEAGDTLWAIASDVAAGRDPRVVVDEIERVNEVDASSIAPGQVLVVPGAAPAG